MTASYPHRERHPALPFADWPLPDRLAWEASRNDDPFVTAHLGTTWRPASVTSAIRAYGRWLGWLQRQNVDLIAEAPDARFTVPRLRAYAGFLGETCAPMTVASYIGVLCMVTAAIFPQTDWAWLRRVQCNLRRQSKPARDKAAEMVSADALHRLGVDLMEAAMDRLAAPEGDATDAARKACKRVARDFRDGLIIAFLAHRPLRVSNLLQIEIGHHLRVDHGIVRITFSADETKGHRRLDTTWPEGLRSHLETYLAQVRPILMAANIPGRPFTAVQPAVARLWVGQGGTPLTAGGLQKIMRRHSRRRFGKAIPAQRARDIGASFLANTTPHAVRAAADVLGHSSLRITERNYIQADPAVADETYACLLDRLTKQAETTKRKRGPVLRVSPAP
ncbi:MAG: tyrosine-type recombinase/integrase [Thermohalobaculum sp.]